MFASLRTLLALPLVALLACEAATTAAAPQPGPPAEVTAITLQPRSIVLTRELPGRVSARRTAEVRARVDGIVEAVLFEEGSDVVENQELYRIEAAPYRADLAAAKANLARAQAAQERAKTIAKRDESLLETNAVSVEAREGSEALLHVAEADVAAQRAAVKSASIDLGYTSVLAPVAGRIGRSAVTEGAYVQRSTATLLATIQQLDTVYIDITQSSAELLRLRRAFAAAELQQGVAAAEVTLILADGHEYPERGTLQFSDATVDPGTGSVSLRAVFPNPRGDLLPGMFVRARLEQGTDPDAILVPQAAITRDQKGQGVALVVDAEGKVERRTVVTDRAIGNEWLISEGLAAGDRVIVEGLQRARPGAKVVVVEAAE